MDATANPALPMEDGFPRGRFLLLAVAITLLAFALRQSYLLGAQVDTPVAGDGLQYWHYAWNLVHHGVFSAQAPAASTPLADSWRSPGFPVLLAFCQRFGGEADIRWAQWLLVMLGSSLVPLSIALGRFWLSRPMALVAGLAIAMWPHLVVFSSTLLSETPFAFGLLLACLLAASADRRDSVFLAASAGLVAGAAALVNPVFLPFPLLLSALLAWRGRRRVALAYAMAFLLLAGAWSWRNSNLPAAASSAQRAQTNLVQGSWPLFHAAWNNRDSEPLAAEYMRQIDGEIALMNADPRAGLAEMSARMRSEPAEYLRWYLLEKPWLLWAWDIRVGWGDVYFVETKRSPYDRLALWQGMHALARALNPWVFVFAAGAALALLVRATRVRFREPANFAGLQVALLACFVTTVHVLLQSEPRYGVAYRPLELLMAVSAIAGLVRSWTRRRASA
jgi:hypothetical protein